MYNNKLNRAIAKINKAPKPLQHWLRNKSIGKAVPLIGTAGIKFEKMTCEEVILDLPNKKKVQNHIQQIHAAASVLLAESASGMVVGMNVPDDKLPLMKSLNSKFIKRSQGAQRAIASLTTQQIEQIRTTDKGEVNVSVRLLDSTGQEVVITEMIWAWIPKPKRGS